MATLQEAEHIARDVLKRPSDDPDKPWTLEEFKEGWVIKEKISDRGAVTYVIERATGVVKVFPSSVPPQSITEDYEKVRDRGHEFLKQTAQIPWAAAMHALAEDGNAKAQYDLGNAYYFGNGVEKDINKSTIWLRRAADQGYPAAQSELGVSYERGESVEKDLKEAIRLYRLAADQGYPAAQYNLGNIHYFGRGVETDFKESAIWYKKAAEQGYPAAQYNLGNAYYSGKGVEKDLKESIVWLRRAAELGHVAAQNDLGASHEKGDGVEKDLKEALKWYRLAAERGYPAAQFNVGNIHHSGRGVEKDLKEGVAWYRKAAEQGFAPAQTSLGTAYERGEGVEKDPKEAVKWYRKAAEQNNAVAQNNLATAYYFGSGVEKDFKEAVTWYRKAAEQNNSKALNSLGLAYYNGEGVEKDIKEAIKWYRKAAEMGSPSGQYNLGRAYHVGEGVEQDTKEALVWLLKASEQGSAIAKKYIDEKMKDAGVKKDKVEASTVKNEAAEQENTKALKSDFITGIIDQKTLSQKAKQLYYEKKYAEAFSAYEALKEAGDADALPWLGYLYDNGYGVKKDSQKAQAYYLEAAEKGDVWGQRMAGNNLVEGKVCPQDVPKGIELLKKSAEKDKKGAAQLDLGIIYHNFKGIPNVKTDYEQALFWYKKRLELTPDSGPTLYNIGLLYESGLGVEKDINVAQDYFTKSLANGGSLAAAKLKKLKDKRSPEFNFDLVNTDQNILNLTQKITSGRALDIPVLLSGPNGSGKHSYALYIAKQLKLEALVVGLPSLIARDKSSTDSLMRDYFKQAEEQRKMLIFEDVGKLFGTKYINQKSASVSLIKLMRSFPYPFICISGDDDEIESQLSEEFIFHIKFEYLTRIQSKEAFKLFFEMEPPKELSTIGALTPQDYQQVKKTLFVLGEEKNVQMISQHLKEISQRRSKSIIEEAQDRNFDVDLVNADINIAELTQKLVSIKDTPNFSLLLYGPPGTGKSEFLRYLAQQLGMEVINKRASDLISKWSGESEKNISSAFKEAVVRKSFLIFDEADSLLRQRDSGDKPWQVQQVNEMLTWMESHPYPFACTTNFVDQIDKAALRRFVFKIKLDYLTKDQVGKAFTSFFYQVPPAELASVGGLTLGDFSIVRKKAKIFGELHDTVKLLDLLKEEVKRKSGSNIQYIKKEEVSFNPKMANVDTNLDEIEEKLLAPSAIKNFSFLLYGPPGTGKSQYLRYLAQRIGIEVIQKRASDLLHKWLGESEQAIAAAFKEAEERKAFLIFDEADGLLKRRNSEMRPWEIQNINEMLTWMESHPYPFACTTNLIETIDDAAMRRFLFKVKFNYLQTEQIQEAFQSVFAIPAPAELTSIKILTPAIFAVAKKKADLFGVSDPEKLVKLVKDELKLAGYKEPVAAVQYDKIAIPALPLSHTLLSEGTSMLQAAVVTIKLEGGGHGSGYFISHDGYLLTNHHVVKDNKFVTVKLATGRQLPGEVMRAHEGRDIALVKVNEKGMAALPIQLLEPQVGTEVYAVGTPFREEYSTTITKGIVSAYRAGEGYYGNTGEETYKLIQSDVSTHGGSSGGAIVDKFGNVVGTHVAGHSQKGKAGLNFSIPIADALKFLEVELKSGSH